MDFSTTGREAQSPIHHTNSHPDSEPENPCRETSIEDSSLDLSSANLLRDIPSPELHIPGPLQQPNYLPPSMTPTLHSITSTAPTESGGNTFDTTSRSLLTNDTDSLLLQHEKEATAAQFSRLSPESRSDMMKSMESVINSVASAPGLDTQAPPSAVRDYPSESIASPGDATNLTKVNRGSHPHPATSRAADLSSATYLSAISRSISDDEDPSFSRRTTESDDSSKQSQYRGLNSVHIDRALTIPMSHAASDTTSVDDFHSSPRPVHTENDENAELETSRSRDVEINRRNESHIEPTSVPPSSLIGVAALGRLGLTSTPSSLLLSEVCGAVGGGVTAEELDDALSASGEEMIEAHDEEMEEELGSSLDEGNGHSHGGGPSRSTDDPVHAHQAQQQRGRGGVTLHMLMAEGIVTPVDRSLTVEDAGTIFYADVLPSGEVRCSETGLAFYSPSAWAVYVKKKNNQAKRSGCGWDSIRFKGKKLLAYKAVWYRKQKSKLAKLNEESQQQQPHRPYQAFTGSGGYNYGHSSNSGLQSLDGGGNGVLGSSSSSFVTEATAASSSRSNSGSPATVLRIPDVNAYLRGGSKSPTSTALTGSTTITSSASTSTSAGMSLGATTPLSASALGLTVASLMDLKKLPTKPEISYFSLGYDHKPASSTQIECLNFPSMHMKQPFGVTFASNALLLVDFHAHLSSDEVVGYLGGRWNPTNQELLVLAAFPCHGKRGDQKESAKAEAKIRRKMELAGLSLVGWYHSHPSTSPQPTLADIKNQFQYQQIAEEGCPDKPPGKSPWVTLAYRPIIGLICSTRERKPKAYGAEDSTDLDSKTPSDACATETKTTTTTETAMMTTPTMTNAATSTECCPMSPKTAFAKETKPAVDSEESLQSEIVLFWTMPPPKEFMNRQNQYPNVPLPVAVDYRCRRNDRISGFVVCEMIFLVEYFKGKEDRTVFAEEVNEDEEEEEEKEGNVKVEEKLVDDGKSKDRGSVVVKAEEAKNGAVESEVEKMDSADEKGGKTEAREKSSTPKLVEVEGPSDETNQDAINTSDQPDKNDSPKTPNMTSTALTSDSEADASKPPSKPASFDHLVKSLTRFFALGTDGEKFVDSILKTIVLKKEKVTPADLDETNVVVLKGDEEEEAAGAEAKVERKVEVEGVRKIELSFIKRDDEDLATIEGRSMSDAIGTVSDTNIIGATKVEQDCQTDLSAFREKNDAVSSSRSYDESSCAERVDAMSISRKTMTTAALDLGTSDADDHRHPNPSSAAEDAGESSNGMPELPV